MKSKKIYPKLSLVGAGPGDIELITLKGIKALAKADVVLYDALVNPELLDFVPATAKKVFVGKRAGHHVYTQDEINQLIVENALEFGHVVRLKGGDPFIFGRGHEELEYAEHFGVEIVIVPGISSSYSVPALQQIPLTKRGVNESFWVVTGTTKSGEVSNDMKLAAASSATVVVLMGMRKLEAIVQQFIDLGKHKLPVAIIQNGATDKEKIIVGTAEEIVHKSAENKMGAPAIIIFGEVVQMHPEFKYIMETVNKN